MQGRLDIFQRTMLHWNDLHPYNAIDVVKLPGPPDAGRLQRAIDDTLERHGLTGLAMDASRRRYQYRGDRSSAVIEARQSLNAEIERQLNTGFARGDRFSPFRFFVVPEKDTFYLGLVYFHVVADDAAVTQLMKDIVDAYAGQSEPPAFELYPARSCLRGSLRKIASLPALIRQLKSSCRPPCRDIEDLRNDFVLFTLRPDLLCVLIAAARRLGATVNDLFLAALLKSVSPLAPGRFTASRRRNLSVGCIVDVRRDLGLGSRRSFGVHLGSFVVTHAVPDGVSIEELARDVRSQTLAIKHDRLYLGMVLELAFVRLLLPVFSETQRKKIYRTNYPLWAGVTNMNLNSLWPAGDTRMPLDYIRAVSTGPAAPLVLSITTFRDAVNIGVSYRPAVFTASDIETIQTGFQAAINQLNPATAA